MDQWSREGEVIIGWSRGTVWHSFNRGKTDFLWKYKKVIGWELRAGLGAHITFVGSRGKQG